MEDWLFKDQAESEAIYWSKKFVTILVERGIYLLISDYSIFLRSWLFLIMVPR